MEPPQGLLLGNFTPSPSLKKFITRDGDNDLLLKQLVKQLPNEFILARNMMP